MTDVVLRETFGHRDTKRGKTVRRDKGRGAVYNPRRKAWTRSFPQEEDNRETP
jgi:hypothetical protein